MSAPLPPSGTPRPAARPTSVVGPVVLTCVGALLVAATLLGALVVAGGFVGLVRSDVLTADGRPGPGALATADAPGAGQVDLVAGERYAVYLVVPRPRQGDDPVSLDGDVRLMSPSGEVLDADDPPGVTVRQGVRGWAARTVGAFRAPETGTYEMVAPSAGVDGAWVAVAADRDFAPFFTGVWRTVLGSLLVVVLGVVGVGVLVGGVVWWVLRHRARRAA